MIPEFGDDDNLSIAGDEIFARSARVSWHRDVPTKSITQVIEFGSHRKMTFFCGAALPIHG
jgi:hypothetical protein